VVKHIRQKFLTAIALAVLVLSFLSLSFLLTGNSWAIASSDGEIAPVIEKVEDKQAAEPTQTIQVPYKIGQPSPFSRSETSKHEYKEGVARIRQFLDGLAAKVDIEKIAQTVFQQIIQNKWAWGILGVLVYVVLLLALFWLKPLWLLQINEWVNRHSPFITVNQKIGDTTVMGIVFRTVISSLLLSYRPRVLDAWVEKNIGKAKDGFEEIDTVKKRKIHISSVPVNLNDKLVQCLTAKDLQPTFERNPARLLIWGEGGAGKTSLACQIGKWAMSEDKAERLCKHRMLPVLIEEELGGEQRFTEAIRQQLKILLDESEPISVELLEQLLKQQRILVIVDHLSEMSEATRQAIPFKDAEFPVKALVVTSRLEEKLDGGNKTTIKPLRVEGNRLSSFMDAYLTQQGKRELFDGPEYFEACRKLSLMVGERDITVLLAKLYADQLIATKEGSEAENLPDNIPDLMLCYLNRLNDSVKEENKPDNYTVHADAKAIAWECLKREYKPQSANYEDVIRAIASPNENDDDKKDKAKVRLKYLENRLRLIRTKEPGYKVLFDLDPLAEYLASLYLVDDCREDEEKWREFLTEVDSKSGAPEAIKGFLLAVRDCYLAKVPDAKVTDFVPEELGRRTDLDPEKVKQVQLKQRIERLKSQLTVPEAEDRIHAGKELRKIGSAAKDAVPTLVNALKDEDISVRVHAAEALAVIGLTAPEIFPVLIEGMKDTNREVRWTALVALRQIGPEPQAAVPDLIKALKNEDKDFRLGAAIGLGGIGSEAKAAVPDLMEALKDESKYVRRFAFLALGEIGWKAKLGIPDLIEALEDEDYEVRNAAWREFRKAVEEAFKKTIRREKRSLYSPDNYQSAIALLGDSKARSHHCRSWSSDC
jgi:HEAT repeat protein